MERSQVYDKPLKITSWGLRFQKGQGRKYDDYHLRPSDDKAEL
mgnify:CR=1 FL=1